MSTPGLSACCASGTVAQGHPSGHVEQINGLECYVSPPKDQSTHRSIVIISDIFGFALPNVRLLADSYARAGFFVYVPDFHQGDSLPIEFLQDAEPPLKVREQLTLVDKGVKTAKVAATLGPWLYRHSESVSRPLIEGFLRTVKMTPGTESVGAIGFW
jgi:dienelactone hydrolase